MGTSERTAGPPGVLLFDAAAAALAEEPIFEPGYWERKGAVIRPLGGRGTALLIAAGGENWVLRHYHRGGVVGRWFRDHFIWLGERRTRSFKEAQLLARLQEMGLPVPAPVGARYRRDGLTYTADLITREITGAVPLSALMREEVVERETWEITGRCLRRFHTAGVYHPDLTANNILVAGDRSAYVLDFDRGAIRAPGRWQQANLARLHRSLRKISAQLGQEFDDLRWRWLLEGYARL